MRLPLHRRADWLRILTTTLISARAETIKQVAARAVKSSFFIEKFRQCSVSLDTGLNARFSLPSTRRRHASDRVAPVL